MLLGAPPTPPVTTVHGQLLLLRPVNSHEHGRLLIGSFSVWQVVETSEAKKMKQTLSKYGVDKSIYDGNQVALVANQGKSVGKGFA